ncbi:MAG: fucose isomerase [Lachnospiraceae bacterium]|nr:fucose isomerase [Lachnospiraceae bacterium]
MHDKVKIGLMPNRREVFNINTAREEYDIIMPIIHAQMPEYVEWVEIDDICEQGMACHIDDIDKIVKKFKEADIDAIFSPFCDFGEESVVTGVAKQFMLPTLIWGTRDKVSTYEHREKETQCGVFAATKVLRNYGVTFSYIWNCEADSPDFVKGFEKFVRVTNVMKNLRNANIASIGDRPAGFYSVIHNQLQLIKNFNISVKPIGLSAIAQLTNKILSDNSQELQDYIKDFSSRVDISEVEDEMYVPRVCAGVMAIEALMKQNHCRAAGFDCFGVGRAIGLAGSGCVMEGELADRGFPTACEMDIWGAVSMLILKSVALGDDAPLLADWTYRHPTNDNGELIWHGGPFAYSLADKAKNPMIKARKFGQFTMYEPHWELKQGHVTMLRMDELDGEYYIFVGDAKTIEGPETTATYVWIEVEPSWKQWEEKLMFGPFIHHVGGVYGDYNAELEEVVRYLNDKRRGVTVNLETPYTPGPKSL